MAHAQQQPHIFSNEAENYIATTAVDSIFLVEVDIRHFNIPDTRSEYRELCRNMYNVITNRVLPKPPPNTKTDGARKASKTNESDTPGTSKGKGKKRPPQNKETTTELAPQPQLTPEPQLEPGKNKDKGLTMNITQGTRKRQATGFVIASRGNFIRILTCAHIVEDVYTKDMHGVTLKELNMAFTFDVICVHQERHILATPSHVPNSRRLRSLTEATVVAIDTTKDLLVLQVDVDDIFLSDSEMCTFEHPTLHISFIPPRVRESVILLGWPPQRSQSVSGGKVSFPNRTYDAVCDIDFNVKGYTMELTEISNLVCTHGYSGGPLLNHESKYIGAYHGTTEMKGYAVSLEDISHFLSQFQVLTQWAEQQ